METAIYNQKGKEVAKIDLPDSVFGARWNANLVHQVIVSMQSNLRRGTAHAKDRSEVSGGGKKPWKQKGTGRARHGSIRSPIWIGGGVTHGPRKDKDYKRKINRKMRTKALFSVLSKKFKDGEVLFLDDVSIKEPKTKYAAELLQKVSSISGHGQVSYKTGRRALIVSPEKREELSRVFRNIKSVNFDELRNINPLLATTFKDIIFLKPKESVAYLAGKLE